MGCGHSSVSVRKTGSVPWPQIRFERLFDCHSPPVVESIRMGEFLPRHGPAEDRKLAGRRNAGSSSGIQEGQQVGVDLVFVRVCEAMGSAGVDLEVRVLDQLR